MFSDLAKALVLALELWNSKDKRKYSDRIAELERAYEDEDNQPRGKRSNAVLDNLRTELCIVGKQLAADVRKT